MFLSPFLALGVQPELNFIILIIKYFSGFYYAYVRYEAYTHVNVVRRAECPA